MRVYIIGTDGITLCRKASATVNDGEFAVASNEELRARDVARLGFVVSQIREIEEARQKRLEQQPETGPHAMVGGWPGSSVLVSRRLICWFMRCCHGRCVTAEQWPATPA